MNNFKYVTERRIFNLKLMVKKENGVYLTLQMQKLVLVRNSRSIAPATVKLQKLKL